MALASKSIFLALFDCGNEWLRQVESAFLAGSAGIYTGARSNFKNSNIPYLCTNLIPRPPPMKRILSCFYISLVLVACKSEASSSDAPTVKRASWKNYGCDLITDQEVAKMFNFDPKESVLNARSLPDQVFCLRTWQKPDWKEREAANEKNGAVYLNPSNRLVVQLFDYVSEEHAKQQMEMLRRDRRSTYEEDVKGIGEDALWSTSTETLLVKQGKNVINVSLEYVDKPHDNLDKAKEVAAFILKKL